MKQKLISPLNTGLSTKSTHPVNCRTCNCEQNDNIHKFYGIIQLFEIYFQSRLKRIINYILKLLCILFFLFRKFKLENMLYIAFEES